MRGRRFHLYLPVMNEIPPGERDSFSRTSGREMAETLRSVLEDQEERKRIRGHTPGPPSSRSALREWAILAVLAGVSAYLWLASPCWLRPAGPEPPDPARIEAGMRIEMSLLAHRVQTFQEREARLPNSLLELGEPLAEIRYERLSASEFALRMEGRGIEVEYSSRQTLQAFLDGARTTVLGGR